MDDRFVGLWQRAALYEPAAADSALDTDATSSVLWLQSRGGCFIDVRAPLDKSFSGDGSFDPGASLFTWARILDARPPGPPDIGRIVWRSQNVVDEYGVGSDDYREVWTRFPVTATLEDASVVFCGSSTDSVAPPAKGIAVLVNGFSGISVEVGGYYIALIAKRCEGSWHVLAWCHRDVSGRIMSGRGSASCTAETSLLGAITRINPTAVEAMYAASLIVLTKYDGGSGASAQTLICDLGLRYATSQAPAPLFGPLEAPVLNLEPWISPATTVAARLVSPSLNALVVTRLPALVHADRPLEIGIAAAGLDTGNSASAFVAHWISVHSLVSLDLKEHSGASHSLPVCVRHSADGGWVARALIRPTSWAGTPSVTVVSLSLAGRPVSCDLLPATLRVGFNHNPAHEGAVLAAVKANNVPALQAALDAGGSTKEADLVREERKKYGIVMESMGIHVVEYLAGALVTDLRATDRPSRIYVCSTAALSCTIPPP